MNQERWSFWKRREEESAGGESLERSESDSPPATPPSGEGAGESCDTPGDGGRGGQEPVVDPGPDHHLAEISDERPSPEVSTGSDDSPDMVAAESDAPLGIPEVESDTLSEPADDESVASSEADPGEEGDLVDQPVKDEEDAAITGEVAGLDPDEIAEWEAEPPPKLVKRKTRQRGTLSKPSPKSQTLSPQQKLLLLDTWSRSGLPARDFGALVNVSRHTLYAWKRKFEQQGPAGLMDAPRGSKGGSRLPELTKRTILMLKQAHPEWGCQRISDMLLRGPALPASDTAVARVLREAGYEMEEVPTRSHKPPVRSFERAKPNQLWQTDLFTFMLKRQNRRVYLVAFMDDHSRFITGYGLHASQSAALVIEVLRASLAACGVPSEILTDNGSQYITWRGKSQFTKELEKRGIQQIVARPRRPQTLGKIERFWGSLWRECVQSSVFLDLADARQRIGLYIDHYNLQRPHQGIGGLVPADRFFGAAPEVLKTLKERVAANSLQLARQGVPKKPFYLTGQLDGKPFSVHREGDRVILHQAEKPREEIDLVAPNPQQPPQETTQAETLPQPLCRDGSPTSLWQASSRESMPGESAIDGLTEEASSTEPPPEEGGRP